MNRIKLKTGDLVARYVDKNGSLALTDYVIILDNNCCCCSVVEKGFYRNYLSPINSYIESHVNRVNYDSKSKIKYIKIG